MVPRGAAAGDRQAYGNPESCWGCMWRSMRTAGLAPYGGGNAARPHFSPPPPSPSPSPGALTVTRCVGDVCVRISNLRLVKSVKSGISIGIKINIKTDRHMTFIGISGGPLWAARVQCWGPPLDLCRARAPVRCTAWLRAATRDRTALAESFTRDAGARCGWSLAVGYSAEVLRAQARRARGEWRPKLGSPLASLSEVSQRSLRNAPGEARWPGVPRRG